MTTSDGYNRAGQIVLVNLINGIEDRQAVGKWRPAILLRREGGQWLVLGLTTKAFYANGAPRVQLPHRPGCGLRRPSFFWSSRPARISALDVGEIIGEVGPEIIPALQKLTAPSWVVAVLSRSAGMDARMEPSTAA